MSLKLLYSMMGMILSFAVISCGTLNQESGALTVPLLVRLEPSSGPIGSQVTVYGSGFSVEEDNIVLVGGVAVVQTDWDISDTGVDGEEEQVVFTVPDTVSAGAQEVLVMIGSEVSNVLSFTVE